MDIFASSRQGAASQEAARDIDVGLRIYMTKVYNYMGLGLLFTAISAYIGAASGIYIALAQTHTATVFQVNRGND